MGAPIGSVIGKNYRTAWVKKVTQAVLIFQLQTLRKDVTYFDYVSETLIDNAIDLFVRTDTTEYEY